MLKLDYGLKSVPIFISTPSECWQNNLFMIWIASNSTNKIRHNLLQDIYIQW